MFYICLNTYFRLFGFQSETHVTPANQGNNFDLADVPYHLGGTLISPDASR